ncbi:MAG TPA: SMI1/KNR4 family protein [Dactylosporangium sp.]|jgi:cell wall assembly regulator SMI1|nr:SMI1/KNR4 family protein [Dactylosporangium sp.]
MPDDERVAAAWARIETALARALPESLEFLPAPAAAADVDAAEAALGVRLPADFRTSLLVHNGTTWGMPSPVPLDQLYDAAELVEWTGHWRDNASDDPVFDTPGVWAYRIDRSDLHVNGPVRPLVGAPGQVPVGTMNGDVHWYLDLDPPPGGARGQVVRVDVECSMWDVLAPSWAGLLLAYAEDLERYLEDPAGSALHIDRGAGPACEWGTAPDFTGERPAWLRGVQAVDPYA